MLIEFPSKTGKVYVNPSFIVSLWQSNNLPHTNISTVKPDEDYQIELPIEEVAKTVAAHFTEINYLSDTIESLTNVIRNR